MNIFFKIGAALVIWAIPGVLFGDLKEDLEARRSSFEAELAQKGEPQFLLYVAELENLERELVAKRDYASAILVRNEAKAVRRIISELAKETGSSGATGIQGRLVFDAKSATTSLSVVLDTESGALRGWRTTEDFARWQLPDIEPGGYEVVLEFVAGSSEGGEIEVSESYFTLSGKIEGNGSETVRQRLGTIKIRSGNGTISISPNSVATGGLMRLNSIELIPAWR